MIRVLFCELDGGEVVALPAITLPHEGRRVLQPLQEHDMAAGDLAQGQRSRRGGQGLLVCGPLGLPVGQVVDVNRFGLLFGLGDIEGEAQYV